MYPLPASAAAKGTATADIMAAFSQLNKWNGFVSWVDTATPTLYNTLNVGLQDLLGSQTTPQAVASSVDTDYAKFLRSRR